MASAVFGSPIKKLYGETQTLTTTAFVVGVMPNFHEVKVYCPTQWRLGLCPRLTTVLYSGSYTNYTAVVSDRNTATHMPLDGMTTAKYLYLGTTTPTRGFYFVIDSTNKNAVTATLDMEYCYDIAGYTSTSPFLKITGTVASGFTVGETVTGATSSATATCVADNGTTELVVKDIAGAGFKIGETINGSSGSITDISAITPVAQGTAYFTDVANDSDGTSSSSKTLAQTGLYTFDLPNVVKGEISNLGGNLYWYRFKPSTTLSATIDIQELYAAAADTNYGYMEGGSEYQFSINIAEVGGFELDHAGSDTLDITWVAH